MESYKSINDDFVILKGCPICKIYNGSLSKFHVMRCIDINNIALELFIYNNIFLFDIYINVKR